MRQYVFYVYILASKSRTLYIGMTNNLFERVREHRAGQSKFTARYKITRLVYVESFQYVNDAIKREKELKDWRRERKVALIEADNPVWEDFAATWSGVNEWLTKLATGQPVPLLEPARPAATFETADPSAALRDDRNQRRWDDKNQGLQNDSSPSSRDVKNQGLRDDSREGLRDDHNQMLQNDSSPMSRDVLDQRTRSRSRQITQRILTG